MKGVGRTMFVAILLLIAGTLNVIYGVAAIADSKFFVNETKYVFSDLHTWGWITAIVGGIQLTGGLSLASGGVYGFAVGVTAATLGAIAALLSIGGAYPFWSLGIFALCLIVLHGLVAFASSEDTATRPPRTPAGATPA